MKIEVLFKPTEFAALPQRDLSQTICVVFDILRATSTIVTALANKAEGVVPVSEISEALEWRKKQPGVLLAGERKGIRIRSEQTGDTDFDLGNSPREFTHDKVGGKTIVTTTTNGTRALRACSAAKVILAGSFLNLRATARRVEQLAPENLLLVGSGTFEEEALEDTLAAGALCDLLRGDGAASAHVAHKLYLRFKTDLPGAMQHSTNGRRLLANAELRDDVAFCLRRDVFELVAELGRDGVVRTAK